MKLKKIAIVVMCLLMCVFLIDLVRVRGGNEPVFTIRIPNNNKVHHVGLLYVYRQDISIGVSEPIHTSSYVELGLWLIPGVEIYSH